MALATFGADAPLGEVLAAMYRDGAVILTGLLPAATMAQAAAEMRERFDTQGRRSESDFNGYRTLRIGGVLGYAPTTAQIIGHPRVLEIADAVLLPFCQNYRIGSTTGI